MPPFVFTSFVIYLLLWLSLAQESSIFLPQHPDSKDHDGRSKRYLFRFNGDETKCLWCTGPIKWSTQAISGNSALKMLLTSLPSTRSVAFHSPPINIVLMLFMLDFLQWSLLLYSGEDIALSRIGHANYHQFTCSWAWFSPTTTESLLPGSGPRWMSQNGPRRALFTHSITQLILRHLLYPKAWSRPHSSAIRWPAITSAHLQRQRSELGPFSFHVITCRDGRFNYGGEEALKINKLSDFHWLFPCMNPTCWILWWALESLHWCLLWSNQNLYQTCKKYISSTS